MAPGLFVVEGNDQNELIEGLRALSAHLKDAPNRDDPAPYSEKKDPAMDEKIEPLARSWYLFMATVVAIPPRTSPIL